MLTYAQIDKDVLKSMEPPGKKWFMCIAVSLTALAMGMYALFIQVTGGLISGISNPINWGVYITEGNMQNFDFGSAFFDAIRHIGRNSKNIPK